MFDIEKVIELIKKHDKVNFIATGQGNRECDTKNFEIVVKELEKRIPKKPLSNNARMICPNCNTLLYSTQSFCDNCGQEIDWSNW